MAQKGMLVYLTTISGANQPGFYYWNNPGWVGIVSGSAGSTLDQSYDFGGAGAGRTITADAGAVTIAGNDGLVITGTAGSGAVAPSGAGTRMVWNPNKAAIRAGGVTSTQWDDSSIGYFSTAMGASTTASGDRSTALGANTLATGLTSTALGNNSTASGFNSTSMGVGTTASNTAATAMGTTSIASGTSSTAMGYFTTASGNNATAMGANTTASNTAATAMGTTSVASGTSSTAMGYFTTASGNNSTTMGQQTIASGESSTAMGRSNAAFSFGESVLGIGATTAALSVNGATQFRAANATDRLLVVGNAIDANNNDLVELGERSDALVILKNGLTRLPSTTNAMITAADGKAVVTKEYLVANSSGTLDQAYDFGGAGAGRTITADTGAVTIVGTDGLVSTGTFGSGALVPSGAGTRMVWNPNKAAFRAGEATGTEWDNSKVGTRSTAFGVNTEASGGNSSAFGVATTASGQNSLAFGSGNTASGQNSLAFGSGNTASVQNSSAFGQATIASGLMSTTFGVLTRASGESSLAFGNFNTASGLNSTSFGFRNTASSIAETVLGIGSTTYSPSLNGDTQFRVSNSTDRLLVVGNAIDANNNNTVDAAERSDALVILKNGNTGLGSSTPADKLHVVGNIRMVDGNQASGNVMVSDVNGTATWTAAGTLASGTLDQAYDFGGSGVGSTITADNGAVTIAGTDGLVSTGTFGSGALAPSGTGTRMVWNPRKAAFRVGLTSSGSWDDTNIGIRSMALGAGGLASGSDAVSLGNNTRATGNSSTAFGIGTEASGSGSTAFGSSTIASSLISTAFGSSTIASGARSTAFGFDNTAPSFGETVLGIGATTYTPSGTGAFNFRAVNSTDRLLVVGNAIDFNSNAAVEAFERSDALVILKNGLTRLPSTTNAMITAADGKAVVTKEYLVANSSGTLDQAYDFGGAGAGRTITADTGAVTIAGTDGLVSTGGLGFGALAPSNNGTRMVWNPRTAAFRAGLVDGSQWNDANIGQMSVAFGNNTIASASYSTAFGDSTTASGQTSTAFGFNSTASAFLATAFGTGTASGAVSTAFGSSSIASGSYSTAFGRGNTAPSYGETVLGIGATTYTPSVNGATQFLAANSSDRLLVVGNAIDTNSNVFIDAGERSDALVILKNGNTGIGTSTPQTKLEIVAGNKITATFGEGNLHVVSNNPQNTDIGGSISLGGFGSSTTATSVFATVEGRKSNAGALSDSGYLAFKTNDVGVLTERMRITQDGNVGIGIASAQTALDIVGAMTVRPFSSPLLTADNQVVPVGTNGNIWLQSNSLVVGARTITLGDGIVIGQLLTLRNSNNIGNFEVADDAINRNTNTIAGGRTLGIDDFITLMWVGTHWSEVNFADN